MPCFIRKLAALLLLALCGGCSHPVRGPADLALYFTCDTNGRLEPCGCFSGQHGGLTRLKTFLAAQPPEPLLLDVGNAIEGPADYQVIKYRYVQRALADLGYSALNVGLREAQLPVAELQQLAAHSSVPMLSANLRATATGQPIFASHRIIEYHGYKIALVGVLDAPRGSELLGEGLALEPMQTALQNLLPTLRGKADFIILLAFADEEALTQLARQFYEFDLILGGRVRQPSQSLVTENRSIVLYTTNESKTVGFLQAKMAAPSKLVPSKFDIVFLHDKIPQDADLAKASDAYRDEVRQTKLKVDEAGGAHADEVPGVRPGATFAGSESCLTCHAGAGKVWRDSGHAVAFASLVARRSEADPSCIGCHTMGFGTSSGYRREFAGKKLVNVGCESCHGPGSEHVAQRQSGEKVLFQFRPLGAADCTTCHHGEFSRPFNWEEFWPKIQHGRETGTASR